MRREQLVKDGKQEPLSRIYARRDLHKALEKARTKLDDIDIMDICQEVIPVVDGQAPIFTLERTNV